MTKYRTVYCIILLSALCVAAVLLTAGVTRAETPYNVAWSRQIGTADVDLSESVAVDASGNAYISGGTGGSLGGPSAGSIDAFLTKYDGAGSVLWSRQFGTTAYDDGYSVAVDASGNAYISGETGGSLGGPNAGSSDAFLTKYNSSGTFQWSRQIGTADYEISASVAVDGSGNAYISGWTYGSLGGPSAGSIDAFLTKYDSSGTVQWSRQIGTTDVDASYSVAVDASGNAYISGETAGSLGGPNVGSSDAFLTKYNSSGTFQWSRQIGTTGTDVSESVAVDGSGNAYISGYTAGSLGGPNAGSSDAFLTKYNSSGTVQWSRQIGTADQDYINSVAVDASGNSYISGLTNGSLGGPNAGDFDAFLTKYDGAGNLLWSRQIGTTAGDFSLSVAADGLGNAYISGYTYGSLGGPNAGSADAFLVKFAPVPEPATLALLALGLPLLVWRNSRRSGSGGTRGALGPMTGLLDRGSLRKNERRIP